MSIEAKLGLPGREWIEVHLKITTTPCIWALCERKAAELNDGGSAIVTPSNVLTWVGQWQLDTEARALRPFVGCGCPLCRDARKDGAT